MGRSDRTNNNNNVVITSDNMGKLGRNNTQNRDDN